MEILAHAHYSFEVRTICQKRHRYMKRDLKRDLRPKSGLDVWKEKHFAVKVVQREKLEDLGITGEKRGLDVWKEKHEKRSMKREV